MRENKIHFHSVVEVSLKDLLKSDFILNSSNSKLLYAELESPSNSEKNTFKLRIVFHAAGLEKQ